MPQDGTVHAASRTHPSWCDPGECTVLRDHPYGAHQSTALFIAPEAPSGTAIELHLTSLFKGADPSPLLLVELADREDDPTPYLFTLPQVRQVRDALSNLLSIAPPDRAGTGLRPATSTAPPT
jgi:hypothetical protein